ncbi:hypothetical protein N3K66_009011 [Trichothecium roseum]|uniref:Uncharacterized protein n=1 Tax=Trichothecium roseum TaxID=47278 RepID=A0ACC0UPT1_9HYPO|nr:hypothetical protein N3K66_009011 [Trichothecium roseum]
MPLKVLVCGGGCSGSALAFWLSRLGHDVTVVEHHAAAQHAAGGLIDVGPHGAQVLERMGLLPVVREYFVPPSDTAFVDAGGQVKGTIAAAGGGGGCRSRYEIARGSLVKALYGATADRARWVFGKTVEGFDEGPDGVTVSFSDGDMQRYDMLVGADGQDSLVRRGMAGKGVGEGEGEGEDPRVRVGVYEAYWSVPRTNDDIVSASGDGKTATYHAPGGRVMTARTHGGAGRTQVRFLLRDDAGLAAAHAGRCSGTQQQEFVEERFADAGWQAGRFLAGMRMADDFYCREAVVVRTQRGRGRQRSVASASGSEGGRVVLVGDAAHCSAGAEAVFAGVGGGGGRGGAGGVGLVGAYVLAGQMARTPGDLKAATEAYGVVIRPFVDEVQGWTGRGGGGVGVGVGGEKMLGTVRRCAMPMGEWGVCVLRVVLAVACFLRVPELLARLMLLLPLSLDVSGGGGGGGERWKMPEYLELQGEKMG